MTLLISFYAVNAINNGFTWRKMPFSRDRCKSGDCTGCPCLTWEEWRRPCHGATTIKRDEHTPYCAACGHRHETHAICDECKDKPENQDWRTPNRREELTQTGQIERIAQGHRHHSEVILDSSKREKVDELLKDGRAIRVPITDRNGKDTHIWRLRTAAEIAESAGCSERYVNQRLEQLQAERRTVLIFRDNYSKKPATREVKC